MMAYLQLETERLNMQPFTLNDVDVYYVIDCDALPPDDYVYTLRRSD